ncbi:hypothetical protein SAMN02910293_01211 [Streptococcus henryi]|uniref:Uncharacterized protein n=1 Tax=Streptococcus henryi TaxID=439219 RepID=A0A1G6BTU7_9STRE|nr:hypothetical protein SAMN02910293_01211 [Streptococcus henryi]
MEDYNVKQELTKLVEKIRQQTFWGLIPEMPEWDFNTKCNSKSEYFYIDKFNH